MVNVSQEFRAAEDHGFPATRTKRLLVSVCYLVAVGVTTVGWLFTVGWMTIEIAKWIFA